MNRDYWFALFLALAVVGSFTFGIHLGWEGAVNSNDLALANGIEIVKDVYANTTLVKFPENISIAKDSNQLMVVIRQNNGRNVSVSSKSGVYMIEGLSSMIISSRENAAKMNESAYGEKSIVITHADWLAYQAAKKDMERHIGPVLNQTAKIWEEKHETELAAAKDKYVATGNHTDLLRLLSEEAHLFQATIAKVKRQYILTANDSIIETLL